MYRYISQFGKTIIQRKLSGFEIILYWFKKLLLVTVQFQLLIAKQEKSTQWV